MKQLAKLVKVRYVEDITHSERVGAALDICNNLEMSQRFCSCRLLTGNMYSKQHRVLHVTSAHGHSWPVSIIWKPVLQAGMKAASWRRCIPSA